MRSALVLSLVLVLGIPLAHASQWERTDPAGDEEAIAHGLLWLSMVRLPCREPSIDILRASATHDGERVTFEAEFASDVARARISCAGVDVQEATQLYQASVWDGDEALSFWTTFSNGRTALDCVHVAYTYQDEDGVERPDGTNCIAPLRIEGRFLRFDAPARGLANRTWQAPYAFDISGVASVSVSAESKAAATTHGATLSPGVVHVRDRLS